MTASTENREAHTTEAITNTEKMGSTTYDWAQVNVRSLRSLHAIDTPTIKTTARITLRTSRAEVTHTHHPKASMVRSIVAIVPRISPRPNCRFVISSSIGVTAFREEPRATTDLPMLELPLELGQNCTMSRSSWSVFGRAWAEKSRKVPISWVVFSIMLLRSSFPAYTLFIPRFTGTTLNTISRTPNETTTVANVRNAILIRRFRPSTATSSSCHSSWSRYAATIDGVSVIPVTTVPVKPVIPVTMLLLPRVGMASMPL
mmetsp:Transcript_15146/g.33872  ORF Transcript_15146/g.33872 Transcript_15146/m.33872 type:complete len:259 (-) Transcript_15146:415-1191(-)